MSGAWVPVDPPRELTEWERDAIGLLAPDARADAIDRIRVADRCTCGCSSVGFSQIEHFPVGEAEAKDADGTPIWVMLFADGEQSTLATLDVLRADGQPIREQPSVKDIRVVKTSAWRGAPSSGQ